MNRLIIGILFLLAISSTTNGQLLKDDVTIVFMKANVLFDAGRYDEAVRMYNTILKEDEQHANALLMRARAKFELGAFKGTKMDAAKYIDINGVTKDLIKLMATTEMKLSNMKAAANYVATAIELDPYDSKMYYLAGEIAIEQGDKNDACEAYARASILGSGKATNEVNRLCGGISKWIEIPVEEVEVEEEKEVVLADTADKTTDDTPESPSEEPQAETKKDEAPASIRIEPKTGDIKTEVPTTPTEAEVVVEKPSISDLPPANLDASQDVAIDEKLSITLTNGIGERKIDSKPNIFMLSDQDGLVVIDICISQGGRVTEAEFNREASTIYRSSMTALALRKAKEFEFLPSLREEQCGSMIFRIRS